MSSATCVQPVAVVILIGFPIHGALGVVGAWRVWWCSVVHVQSTLSGCELDISATSAVVCDKISFDASEESASGGAPGAIGLVCFLPRPMVDCVGLNCARHAHVRMLEDNESGDRKVCTVSRAYLLARREFI